MHRRPINYPVEPCSAGARPNSRGRRLRRFRVTHLRKQGTPEDLLRFWIGHGDKTVTGRYAKLSEDVAFRKAQAERVGIGFNLEVVPCCPRHFDREQPVQVVVM